MSSVLQRNLKSRLEAQGISATELERRTGLKHSAVQNILYGRSKRPGIDIVSAIAKELGCSMEALLSDEPLKDEPFKQAASDSDTPWNATLFVQATEEVNRCVSANSIELHTDEVLRCIKEVYNYTLFSEQKAVDQKFVEWLVNKYFVT